MSAPMPGIFARSPITQCAQRLTETRAAWRFHKHDPVFSKRSRQDFLWKFDLPSKLRISILHAQDEYNLNAFSLFDSQETLLETMWFREYVPSKEMRQMYLTSNVRLPLSSTDVAEILRDHGYETHPKGMAQPLGVDFERTNDGNTAYFDLNAEAVRRNGEVPNRPIRLTFERVATPGGNLWRLTSIAELETGVTSRAMDRAPDTPKNSPWLP